MFVDEAVILCRAGRGGKGCQSFDRRNPHRPRPTGGDGGDGGSVIVEARPNIQTLLDFRYHREFIAQNGGNGGSNSKKGFRGKDLVIGVPVGTEVLDQSSDELLKDLDATGKHVTVCRGGAGGHGNDKRRQASEGEPGEEKEILFKLKLLADVGLVGFPNAGKSTFISRVSSARSKAAPYPFTTKNPVLGVVKFEDDRTLVLADIPGIIEGAHAGRGLGLEFLRHVERTRVLLHVVDLAAVDGRDPVEDYRVMRQELLLYSNESARQALTLSRKPEIVAANKMDIPQARENLKRFKRSVRAEIFPISAATGQGIDVLLNRLRQIA